MTHPDFEWDPQLLVQEQSWLQQLARHVARDRAGAEDLAQDTLLAALESPPRGAGRPGRLRAWLSAVVRNLARSAERGDARRTARESSVAGSELQLDDTLDELAHAQLLRTIFEVVNQLPEPNRSAVRLRYIDNLSSVDVAEQLQVEPATVRKRVSRGLEEVRRQLERRGVCAPAMVATSFTSAVAKRGIWMGIKSQIALGVAVATALSVWFFVATDLGRGGTARELKHGRSNAVGALDSDAPPERREVGDGSPELATLGAATDGARREVESDGRGGRSTGRLRGVVVDSSGAPIEGAEVVYEDPPGTQRTERTDEEGVFRVELIASADRAELSIASSSYLPAFVTARVGEAGEWTLARCPQLRVRLVGPSGGKFATCGRVQIEVRDEYERRVEREADVDGRAPAALFDDLPLGRVARIWALAEGYPGCWIHPELELEAEGEYEITFDLVRGATVTGTVRSSESHEPIAGAEVWADAFSREDLRPASRTDSEGRFRLDGVDISQRLEQQGQDLALLEIHASAEGYARLGSGGFHARALNASGEYVVDLELPTGSGSLDVRVTGERGAPVGDATVIVTDGEWQVHSAQSDERGLVRFEELPPGRVGAMAFVRPSGKMRAGRATQVTLALEAGEAGHVALVLGGARLSYSGSVVDGNGRPLPGVVVRAELRLVMDNLAAIVDGNYAEVTADEHGRYLFTGLPRGYFEFAAVDPDNMRCFDPPSTVVKLNDDAVEARRIVGGACSSFSGTVTWTEPRLSVGLSVVLLRNLDEVYLEASVAPDGSFQMEPAVAGLYTLAVREGNRDLASLAVGPGSANGLRLNAD